MRSEFNIVVLARFSQVHKIERCVSYKKSKVNYIMYKSEYLDDSTWLKLHMFNES